MERKHSDDTEVLDEFLSDYLFPPQADGGDPRACPKCQAEGRDGGRLSLRGGTFGAFIACANYPECTFRRKFGQPGEDGENEDESMGTDPETGLEVQRKTGRFGPYVTDGTTNATLPKDLKPEDVTEEQAIALIDARAAKGPAKKKGRKAPAKKKAAPKKPAAKKKAKAS